MTTPMTPYTLGIDIGTSGCKAVVFDDQGQPAASAYREYHPLCPEYGWAELDSEEVIGKCLAVITEAAASAPAPPSRSSWNSRAWPPFTGMG